MSSQFFLSTVSNIGLSTSQESLPSVKRERKLSLVLPGSAASAAQVLTIDEVRFAIQNIKDMQLAHEIAINPDFSLKIDDPESSLEKRIKMHVHNWQHFRDQLNRHPPIYDHAIVLLADIKYKFSEIMPDNAENALKCIEEGLNENIINRQADMGCLDLKAYAKFIIQWLAKLCTRIREHEVSKLKEIDDVVVTFRRILEVMDRMQLDKANFLLDAIRSEVITYSVDYEKQKLNEFLQTHPGGFPATAAWLQRNKCENPNLHLAKTNTLINAYLEFFDWNPDHEYPEIMSMDQERISELATNALRLCCIASIMTITDRVPIICENTANRFEILNHAALFLEDVSNEEDLQRTIGKICQEIKSIIVSKLEENGKMLAEDIEGALKDSVLSLARKDSSLRSFMWGQIIAYLRLAKMNRILPPVPPGYTDVNNELQTLANTFKRFTVYNYLVCGDHYETILDELFKSSTPTESQSTADGTENDGNEEKEANKGENLHGDEEEAKEETKEEAEDDGNEIPNNDDV